MRNSNLHFEPEIPDHFNMERINVPDGFASRVMDRIAVEKTGGLTTLSSGSKIALLSLVVLIYASLGVFIGMQSHNSITSQDISKKEKAIIELKQTHHLDPVSSFDKMLRPFGSIN
jgi:hypothetical protein